METPSVKSQQPRVTTKNESWPAAYIQWIILFMCTSSRCENSLEGTAQAQEWIIKKGPLKNSTGHIPTETVFPWKGWPMTSSPRRQTGV
ncbi:hypothetical protein TMatcc_003265 [Talaromyces marneffei ATCC 18224]|uniref:uncharacterized protein n=1 Tax=Talaromyces marneffei TaxID=37727 RepID=UPI0012A7E469|nr:uncharacterized protein EYB26_001672 [Talaromyces marneffei]KAE8555964.1 hypothetical protein EYB25_000663 [Talaromyces marneffei]QGA14020.1 hypothetical protein EYB26_001672 [Talaromyces marneffei]